MAEYKEHLEKLVFEVLGAEEGKRKLEALAKAEEKYAKSTAGLKKAARERAKAETEAAKEIEDAQKRTQAATKETLKVAGAGLAALAALAVKTAAEMEAATGRAERSMRKIGASTADMQKALDSVDKSARQFGGSLIEQRDALSQLVDASGDLATAQRDLALANDIAATGDMELAQASRALAQARKGEIGELVNLDGMNKQYIDALNTITTDAARGEAAINALTESYKGSAKELKGSAEAMKNLEEAGKEILVVIGDSGRGLINGFAEMIGLIGEGDDLINNFAGGMRKFAAEAKEAASYIDVYVAWRKQGGVTGEKSFAEIMSERDTKIALAERAKKQQQAAGGGGGGAAAPDPRTYQGDSGPTMEQAGFKPGGGGRGRRGGAGGGAQFTTLGEETGFLGDFGTQEDLDAKRQADEEALARAIDAADKKMAAAKRVGEVEKQLAKDLAKIEDERLAKLRVIEGERKQLAKDTAMAALDGVGKVADSFVEGEGAKAAISGALEAAKAIAAYAEYNIPAGIGHTAASIAFFKVAADAGKGGGGGASAAGASAAATSARTDAAAEDQERVALGGDRAFGAQRRGGSTTLNIYSAFPPSPEQARQLADAIKRDGGTRA